MHKLLLSIICGILICVSFAYAENSADQKLSITDFDINIDSQTDANVQNGNIISVTARPNSHVSFDIDIQNLYTTEEDIKI
jgi:hypothetical protein